jgi:hypothetical protein
MPFVYPSTPHVHKHGPAGYLDYTSYKDWLRDDFCFRCVYCLEREQWYPSGHAGFGVEHIKPKSIPAYAALLCYYPNLVYACNRCNSQKQNQELIDPCSEAMAHHLRVSPDGRMEGLTKQGTELIDALALNQPAAVRFRQYYLLILSLDQEHAHHPRIQALYLHAFGFPDDLTNLKEKRPESNTRPEGLTDCYFQQRLEGRLPEVYGVEVPR